MDPVRLSWVLALVVLVGECMAMTVLVSLYSSLFLGMGGQIPPITQVALAGPYFVWALPLLAGAGYLIRHWKIGSETFHASAVVGLLAIGIGWAFLAFYGFYVPLSQIAGVAG